MKDLEEVNKVYQGWTSASEAFLASENVREGIIWDDDK